MKKTRGQKSRATVPLKWHIHELFELSFFLIERIHLSPDFLHLNRDSREFVLQVGWEKQIYLFLVDLGSIWTFLGCSFSSKFSPFNSTGGGSVLQFHSLLAILHQVHTKSRPSKTPHWLSQRFDWYSVSAESTLSLYRIQIIVKIGR